MVFWGNNVANNFYINKRWLGVFFQSSFKALLSYYVFPNTYPLTPLLSHIFLLVLHSLWILIDSNNPKPGSCVWKSSWTLPSPLRDLFSSNVNRSPLGDYWEPFGPGSFLQENSGWYRARLLNSYGLNSIPNFNPMDIRLHTSPQPLPNPHPSPTISVASLDLETFLRDFLDEDFRSGTYDSFFSFY